MNTEATLQARLDAHGVKFFSARELLTFGASHHAGPVQNSLPPVNLLPNLLSIAIIANMLRTRFGHPIRVLSAYRSPRYNDAIGGAANSMHLQARALDLAPSDPTKIRQWIEFLEKEHVLRTWDGGLGVYRSFCHIDNGRHRKW
jgi:uncharacterized protein YcbK (DUF882 family)